MSKLLILKIFTFFTAVLLLHSLSFADVPEDQKIEINHLLDFVKNSPCTFIRNGSSYPGEKSVAHIQKKYDYYRDDIKNTEDFINYSATKSTMSGKYYTVVCPDNKTIKAKDWLLNELALFRTKQLRTKQLRDK